MTVNTAALLGHLSPALVRLVADLSARAADPAVSAALRDEHAAEARTRRTADPFEVWVDGRVVQIGAAWLLSLLFVRTLEDRGLLPPRLKDIHGDHRGLLRGLAPFLTDTDYLLLLFRELSRHRAVRDVFDPNHNPVWILAPSPDMASELLALCRDPARLGGVDLSGDTRFLGDVYERLDEGVRDRYALLQTPDFVEAFILDRALSPALAERGVDRLSLIDPACGSGHFLLGAFRRLFLAWSDADPGAGPETWASRALSQVYGVDLNPYAVAIARFRLVLAYLQAAGLSTLDAGRDLRLNLAVADSLRPVEGARQQRLGGGLVDPEQRAQWALNPYAASQGAEAARVLGGRSFDVVVGNPPYITVKDAVLRDVYRELYKSAYREFQLVAPFTERFFGLANEGGWVGAIVGNGFMKQLFGKKLIEEVLPSVDLTEVVDTSGAFIPGHGTPTVILFGRRQKPQGDRVLAVMGKRGEPTVPENPAKGKVWSSISNHDMEYGYDDDYITVAVLSRHTLSNHPWSLGGGGATGLKDLIASRCVSSLGSVADEIGAFAVARADEVYEAPTGLLKDRVEDVYVLPHVRGADVRDWYISSSSEIVFPYDDCAEALPALPSQLMRMLTPYRSVLAARTAYGKTQLEHGLTWYEYSMLFQSRAKEPLLLSYANIATHLQVALVSRRMVLNSKAPVIKLPAGSLAQDYLALLGYLSSSLVCFWIKQVSHDKGSGTDSGKWQDDPAKIAFEFSATQVGNIPIPDLTAHRDALIDAARRMDAMAQERGDALAALFRASGADFESTASLHEALRAVERREEALLARQVALQENIDWLIYQIFGLATPECGAPEALGVDGTCLLGARPFEVLRARSGRAEGTDGQRLYADPTGAVSPDLHEIWRRRIAAIGASKELRLLEDDRWKRRWMITPKDLTGRVLTFQDRLTGQLQSWLLTRLEAELRASPEPTPRSTRSLTQALHRDAQVRAVAELLSGHPDPDLETLLSALTSADAVPYLAAWRYKEPGLKKFRLWQRTWEAQRAEDAWEAADPATRGPRPAVPLPPAYDSGDFAKPTFWGSRGKLDVPKERFIAYPGLSDEEDPTPLLGWAGWDHADRMAALGHLLERYNADPERLPPILAGMVELQPWVDQWHGDDRRYGTPLGPLWAGHIDGALAAHRLTRETLTAWRPAAPTRGRKKR